MKRLLIVTGVALIAITGSAFAQGMQEPGWGGGYVGGQGGYGTGDRDGCFVSGITPPPPCGSDDEQFDYNQDGWLVGGQVGYNHMFDSILLGLEADAAFASIKSDDDIEFDGFPANGEWTWLAAFKARLGYAIDSDGLHGNPGESLEVLLFATGGLALAGYDFESSSGCEFTQTRDGYLVGGGVELKISQRASVKLEYDHMDFGSERQHCTSSVIIFDLPTNSEADATLDVIKFGFNYAF